VLDQAAVAQERSEGKAIASRIVPCAFEPLPIGLSRLYRRLLARLGSAPRRAIPFAPPWLCTGPGNDVVLNLAGQDVVFDQVD
jgi:hypothetical protein